MKSCPWCHLSPDDERYLLLQSPCWNVYLADKQDYIGRCIVVLRRHCEGLSQLTAEEWNDLKHVIENVEAMLRCVFHADICNWSCLMNDAFKDGDTSPHLHLHVRPRSKTPFSLDSDIFYDEEFGHHYQNHKESKLSVLQMEKVYESAKAYFNAIT